MGGHGTILESPWPETSSNKSWQQAWPEIDTTTDPIQAAADYYLLFGIINNAFIQFEPIRLPSNKEVIDAAIKLGFSFNDMIKRTTRVARILERDPRKELTELSDSANYMMTCLVEKLDPVFKSYIYMACGGELRHHRAIGGLSISASRSKAWAAYKKIVKEYGAESVLTTTAKYFRDFDSNSYGSEKWAQAAELLLQREKGELGPTEYLNKMLFVDRVFTLEHNGGCFLNKIEWGSKRHDRGTPFSYGINYMKDLVLNSHCSNPPNVYKLFMCASDDVRAITKIYFQTAVQHGMSPSVTDYEEFIDVSNPIEITLPKIPSNKNYPYTSENTDVVVYKNSVNTGINMENIKSAPSNTLEFLNNNYDGNIFYVKMRVKVYDKNGIEQTLSKTYTFKDASELSDKLFYWKHLSKKKHPGATGKTVNISVYFNMNNNNFNIKIDYPTAPKAISGSMIATMIADIHYTLKDTNE